MIQKTTRRGKIEEWQRQSCTRSLTHVEPLTWAVRSRNTRFHVFETDLDRLVLPSSIWNPPFWFARLQCLYDFTLHCSDDLWVDTRDDGNGKRYV